MKSFAWFALVSILIVAGGCGDDSGPITPRTDGGGTDAARVDGGRMCVAGRVECGGVCVDTNSNPAHCGACGNACGATETCDSGSCREMTRCSPGEEDCGSGCVDVGMNDLHCGRCGNACSVGESCMDGACQPDTCPTGEERCGAACTDTDTDNANCGACDAPCEVGEMCAGGSCSSACAMDETLCTVTDGDGGMMSICVDTDASTVHCGGCNMACDAGQVCNGGTCECPADTVDCDGVCADTDTDSMHCGMCDNACPMGQSCSGGSCECPGGLEACGAACVNTDTDNANCGTCDTTCTTPAETCVMGSCMSACGAGQVMCGAMCVDLNTDRNNCGACTNACAAAAACVSGVCRPENDERTDATDVLLPTDGTEATLMGSTDDATRDGPTISGCAANGPNVWYAVTLATRGVLWVDTAGSSYDTAVFITNGAGDPVSVSGGTTTNPGLCNDDCCGGDGDFTSGLQSCAGGALAAGTYYISVGGYSTTSTGDFTLHVQFLPDTGFLYGSRLDGVGTTTNTVLVGTSEAEDMCAGGFSSRSGEDMRWFASCGTGLEQTLSTCAADGGTYTRADSMGSSFDPVMYVRSGQTGAEVACNDDGPSTLNCRGTGGDSANFGARLDMISIPRGIGAVFIDSRGLGGTGMRYSMSYDVGSVP